MSLGVSQNLNATDFFRSGKYAFATSGKDLLIQPFPSTFFEKPGVLFLHRTGQWQTVYQNDIGPVIEGVMRFDPFLVDTNPSGAILFEDTNFFWALGAYIPQDNSGNLYHSDGTGIQDKWQTVDYLNAPLTPTGDLDPFPNVSISQPRASSGIVSGVLGYWATTNNFSGNTIIFEGWDHTGGGGRGTLVRPNCTINIDGNPTDKSQATIFVDLETGLGTPVLEMPSVYTDSPLVTGIGTSALFGDNVFFNYIQWLPDDDSTLAAPKGRIFMSANNDDGSGFHYVKTTEFNPLGVSGTPTRTHFKIDLLSRFAITESNPGSQPAFPGANTNNLMMPTGAFTQRMVFDPVANRPTLLSSGTFEVVDYDNDPWTQNILQATPTAVVDILQAPLARQKVTTNRVTIFGSDAVGDLGELVSNVDVNWALKRISTKNEVMSTAPTDPANPYFVDNSEISENNLFPLEVRQGTNVLILDTDYEVTSGDRITFTGHVPDGSVLDYTMDYGHPNFPVAIDTEDPTTFPFGTLLVANSTTDTSGEATTRVQYPDDDGDVGFVDQLTLDDT